MRNLFLKIFLWFWVTFVIVATVLSAIIASIRSETIQSEVKAKIVLYMPLEAKKAVEVYEREGKEGLQRHFDGLQEGRFVQAYLFDDDWREVLDHTPSPRVAEFAKGAHVDIPVMSKFTGRSGIAAQQAIGADGRRYTTLIVVNGPSGLAFLRGLGSKTLLYLFFLMLVGGVFCCWLARHIANPVVHLSETAGRIADGWLDARGDSSIRSRRDEIGRLGVSFDRMAERIESLVRGQQRLLGDVSHELRSPLARLSVAEGLLRQCPAEERGEYLDRIALEVQQLDQLIGQLLVLTRIDSGADSSYKERIELMGLVQEVAVDGHFEAQARRCAVKVHVMQPCMATGAREQLRRAIENVVRNAIRHTRADTEVEITVCRQGAAEDRAVIQVRDHGPGLPDEHLDKIFQPFYRVPAMNGEMTGGAGLGLAITERVLRMYGGSVRASNAGDGGLVVELELPVLA